MGSIGSLEYASCELDVGADAVDDGFDCMADDEEPLTDYVFRGISTEFRDMRGGLERADRL